MPDPEQDPAAQRLYSPEEFGGVIRRLYPSLADTTPDNNKLTTAILKVHPELRDHVMDPSEGVDAAPKPPVLPEYGRGMRPPSPIGNEDDPTPIQRRASAKGGSGNVPTTVGEVKAGARRQDESYAGQVFASPVTGATRMVGGVKQVWNGKNWEQRAEGAANVIGGAMEAGMSAVPGALVEAPLAVGAGLLAGTGGAYGVEKAGEAMNAPPGFVHLASELTALAAGVGGGKGVEAIHTARATRAKVPIYEQLGTEDANAVADAAREQTLQESGMQADFAAGNAAADDADSLHNLLQYKNRQFQDQEIDKLSLGLAENYRLSQIAKKIKSGEEAGHGSPFDTLDAFAERPPAALSPMPEPAGLLGPGSPATFLAGPSELTGETFDPNAIDQIHDTRPIATSETPPPPLIQTLGEQLATDLQNQPPAALQPRPSAPTRVKMEERQEFQSRKQQVVADAVSEMEHMPHQRGSLVSDVNDPEGNYYTPPVAGSDWYWRVVGKDSNNPPNRATITELMRAFKDSGGKLKGSELTDQQVETLQKAVDLKTQGGARRAYDRWAPEIDRAVKNRTTAMLGYERVARERAAAESSQGTENGGESPSSPEAIPPPEGMTTSDRETPAGPPSPVEETTPAGSADRADLTDEQYIQQAKDVADTHLSSLSDFFEHMKGEEGHLILNVAPSNKRGLKDWLDRHADEYGEEDWHQKATEALADGNQEVAWRIAAMASARSMAAAGARGSETREHQQVSMAPEEIADFKESPRYKKQFAQLKKDLGGKVPSGIDLNEMGQMTFGPPEKNLKAAATDLLLGKNFAADVIDMADPRKIIRIEGNRDPELRINRQIAEQLVKSMPDEVVEPLLELLKIPDRAEFAKHFARTVSSWGKGLRMLKDWQDDHWNEIVHIANPRPEGIGMGAAHLDEIRSTGGFVDWLKDATAQDREDVGFGYPQNIKEGTEEATKFAKSWFKQREARQARRVALAKTIGELAEDGSSLDKALIAGALEPTGTKSRGTLDAVENTSRAFVISQPVTLIRNMWTQAGRYSVGVLDDALAAGYSMVALDPKGATKYYDRAVETAKSVASPGNASTSMLKTPWLDSLQTTYDYMADGVADLPVEDIRKTIRLLDEFPRRAATYSGGLSLENTGDARPSSKIPGINKLIQPEVRNFVTVLGRTQEMAFRGAVFDSSVRSQLTAEGLDPNVELAGDPTKLIGKLGEKKMDQIIGGAVASALDYTFAAKPYPGSIPALLLNTFSNIPVFSAMLRMGMPFPRFNFVSAPRWIYDHSPASLLDIPMGLIGQFTHENAPLKGRLYRGLEAQKIQDKVIPHLASEIGKAEYTIADKTQEFVRLKIEGQQAAKTFRELEKRASQTGMLPEIHDQIMQAGSEMQEKIAGAQAAKQDHAEAVTQLRELKKQQKVVEEKLLKIKEIGAPTTAEYFARQTTGAAMLTAAYLMRSSDGAKDTKWYEYNVEAPYFGKHTLDLRSFAPMVQFLLPADVMHSVYEDTDWKQVHEYLGKHPLDWEGAMQKYYHGKYTGGNLAAEAATAFLSISPASGATASLIDYITGRTGTVKQGITQTAISAVLSTVGQFIGRFTTPIRPLKDIAGQFDPEEAKARIPEESSDKSHHAQEIYGPALANIPYASEAIPEKKSPLTGEAISTVNPLARALAGLTEHDRNRIEVEIAHSGIEYSKMVPRQTGDREFDNAVAEAYHQGLVKYAGKLLDHPQYQGMNPELRRDVIGSAFGGLKQWALAEAGKKLGLDAKATHEKIESPAAKQKIERWKGYLQQLREETERDHPQPPAEPQPQASNQPPSGVGFQPQPLRQHVDRGLEQGIDARPPAGL